MTRHAPLFRNSLFRSSLFPAPLLLAPLLLAACAQRPDIEVDPADVRSGGSQRYAVTGTVLESPEHGPQLCHSVATSLPPQCGGPDVAGWTWDGLAHEAAQGTRWGTYALVGTWDGTTFTLTEPARAASGTAAPVPDIDFTSPCPAPAGGWKPTDPARATNAAFNALTTRAPGMPGFAGLWIDQNGGENDPRRFVVNIRFTGDPATREAALRAIWGGALCLSTATRTQSELDRIQAELTRPGVLQSSVDVVANRVDLTVYAATPAEQKRLDATYGAGAVRLTGWLRPL
jgi:hypothetical protein